MVGDDVVLLVAWTLKVWDVLAQILAQAPVGVGVGEVGKVLFAEVVAEWNIRKGFRPASTGPVLWREEW